MPTARGCGQPFVPRRPNQRHCSAKCHSLALARRRQQAWTERDAKIRLCLQDALKLLAEDNRS